MSSKSPTRGRPENTTASKAGRSTSRSTSKSRSTMNDTKSIRSDWSNKTHRNTRTTATSGGGQGGKTRAKLKKDLQSRVMVPNEQGNYVDLTPEPLAFDSAPLSKPPVHAPTASVSGADHSRTAKTPDTSHTATYSNIGGSTGSRASQPATSSIAHHRPSLAPVRPAVPSVEVKDTMEQFFHGDTSPPDSLAEVAGLNKPREAPRQWAESALLAPVTIRLEETPTMTLFHVPARRVWAGTAAAAVPASVQATGLLGDAASPWLPSGDPDAALPEPPRRPVATVNREAEQTQRANAAYTRLIEHRDRDRYLSAATETPCFSQRARATQTAVVATRDASVESSAYDLACAYAAPSEPLAQRVQRVARNLNLAGTEAPPPASMAALANASVLGEHSQSQSQSQSHAHTTGADAGDSPQLELLPDGPTDPAAALLRSNALRLLSTATEQAVVQRLLGTQQLLYKTPLHYTAYPAHLTPIRAFPAGAVTAAADTAAPVRSARDAKGGPEQGVAALLSSDPAAALSLAQASTAARASAGAQPCLTSLWDFECAWTRGRPATCISLNKADSDVIAVGYGALEDSIIESDAHLDGTVDARAAGGMVCVWTPLNPHHPVLVRHTRHAVTSVAFAPRSTSVLAVGFSNGDLHLYDVCDGQRGEPVAGRVTLATSTLGAADVGAEGHTDAVWALQWLAHQRDLLLVSGSGDGTVRAWTVKHAMQSRLLARLTDSAQRQALAARKAPREDGSEEALSVAASNTHASTGKVAAAAKPQANFYGLNPGAPSVEVGLTHAVLSLAVPRDDPALYYVAGAAGMAHKCSLSYDDRPLDTFPLHAAAVYRVACSPYLPALFLTCSADGTVALSHHKRAAAPLLDNVVRLYDYVVDIAWCPGNATAFAFITDTACLYLWDLFVSAVEPVCSVRLSTTKTPTFLHILASAPVILVGLSDGSVQAVHIANVPLSFGPCVLPPAADEDSTQGVSHTSSNDPVFKEQCERLHYAVLTHCDFDCFANHDEESM